MPVDVTPDIDFDFISFVCFNHVISVLFLLCFHAGLFIDALWSPAGKGL